MSVDTKPRVTLLALQNEAERGYAFELDRLHKAIVAERDELLEEVQSLKKRADGQSGVIKTSLRIEMSLRDHLRAVKAELDDTEEQLEDSDRAVTRACALSFPGHDLCFADTKRAIDRHKERHGDDWEKVCDPLLCEVKP